MMQRIVQRLLALFSIAVFCLALWAIYRILDDYSLHDIAESLRRIPWPSIVWAALLAFTSYGFLAGSDFLATLYAGVKLRFGQVAVASFISQSIAHSTGFGALTGSAIRYRLYSSSGVSALDVAKIVAFFAVSFALGIALALALAVLFEAERIAAAVGIPLWVQFFIGVGGAVVVVGYAIWCALVRKPLSFREWSFSVPSWKMALGQLFLALGDLLASGAVLFVLLPDQSEVGFLSFMGFYAAALSLGIISHVPGGLGVFEGTMLLFLSHLPADQVLGALLVNRVIYNFIPLCTASVLLGGFEIWGRIAPIAAPVRRLVSAMSSSLAPGLFAVMALISGGLLLFSGATPAVPWRREFLASWIPLPVVEVSHLLGSVAGICLIILARGLFRRLDGAYVMAVIALLVGIVLSLLKGVDYEEALLLTIIFLMFVPTRKAFYRHASLLDVQLYSGWMAAIVIALVITASLTFFSFKHVEYSDQLWWQFAFSTDAPRSLRALVAVGVVLLAYSVVLLLRPVRPKPQCPSDEDKADARRIVENAPTAEAQLALLGDKSFFFSKSRQSFLMYAVSGKSWVVMGDPVGPHEEWPDLIWAFRELVDRYNGYPVFYQVGAESLPLYLDLGLSFVKLGEEARVFLPDFSLQGPGRRELRYMHNRALRDGASLEIVPPEQTPTIMDELRAISDSWMKAKKAREKGFSLGFFDEEYLSNFSIAVARREGKIVAFASVWLSGGKEEMTVDLMRHSDDSGYGVMDYLFLELMVQGKEMGYQWFSLGLAPLSGFRRHRRGPLWSRIGHFIYRYGENFYNFKGLRSYKEKFNPVWRPKFMATPGGIALPRVAADVAALIAGGVRGLVTK